MDSQPPQKRARTNDDEVELKAAAITRSPSLWFADGSVVLQAEATQFRVHMSILSLHSYVFRDMFEIPQPPSCEMVEGCPIVHLFDSAEDVQCMLSAMLEKLDRPCPAKFSYLAAMLRLGRKYGVDHMVSEATNILESAFPSTLNNIDKPINQKIGRGIDYTRSNLIDIVNLAQDTDLRSILPVCYMHLMKLPDVVVKGAKREDNSLASLNVSTQVVILRGRDRMIKDAPLTSFRWVTTDTPSSLCQQRAVCVRFCCQLMNHLWRQNSGDLNLEKYQAFAPADSSLCSSCKEVANRIHDDGRQTTWDRLPSYFDLPPWQEVCCS